LVFIVAHNGGIPLAASVLQALKSMPEWNKYLIAFRAYAGFRIGFSPDL